MKKILKISVLLIAVMLVSSIAYAGITERVSVSSADAQGNGTSGATSISADGRFVAFSSHANNLVSGDTNESQDVFVHDRQTGVTQRVSISSSGSQGNYIYQLSSVIKRPSISADGRFVAFRSYANNLVSGDTNNTGDIFVHDRQTSITERVSISSSGAQAYNNSNDPSISADGRFVAFCSWASNLVSGDTNGNWDIFVHDMEAGITQCVSISSYGIFANGDSWIPSISADGRFVAFSSFANNLVSGDTNGKEDIFVHDRQTGITQRVSISSEGWQANGYSYFPSISADGRFIAFASYANNLVSGDTTTLSPDVFVHDRQTGKTQRVSISSDGVQANGGSGSPSISADGRFVAFGSLATNLVSGGQGDVFVHDRMTGKTQCVSISTDGAQANDSCYGISINSDGRIVAFDSLATNLVSGDTNGYQDVFVHDLDFSNIQGTVDLQNYFGEIAGIPMTINFSNVDYPISLDLNSNGDFTIPDILYGTYDIRIKASHWLANLTSGVVVSGDTNIGIVTLTNGDVVDNNEVDFSDINAIRAAYGSFPGNETWNAMADIDGSGEVDFADINIVRSNYGEIGE